MQEIRYRTIPHSWAFRPKKKELIGNYKNAGTDWRPEGQPRRVNVYDFEDKELGKAIP